MSKNVRKLLLPLLLYLGIFVFKAYFGLGELQMTAVALSALMITFALWYNEGELGLMFIGILLGLFIEIGMTGIAGERQQIWLEASFFGIPYWLPLAWGAAFVVLPRVGIYLRQSQILTQ